MTTELMSLERSKKSKLEVWTKKGTNLRIDLYVDPESYQMIINDGTFSLNFAEYANLCQMLKKNGFNWSVPI